MLMWEEGGKILYIVHKLGFTTLGYIIGDAEADDIGFLLSVIQH